MGARVVPHPARVGAAGLKEHGAGRPRRISRSGALQRLNAIEGAAEVVLLDLEVIAGLEVEPEPVGGGKVARQPQRGGRASDTGRYIGPDLSAVQRPTNLPDREDAEAWLTDERRLISSGSWTPPPPTWPPRAALKRRDWLASSRITPARGWRGDTTFARRPSTPTAAPCRATWCRRSDELRGHASPPPRTNPGRRPVRSAVRRGCRTSPSRRRPRGRCHPGHSHRR